MVNIKDSCARTQYIPHCNKCIEKARIIMNLNTELDEQKENLKIAHKKIENLERRAKEKNPFKIEDIQDNDKMVKFYTGLQNFLVVQWLYSRLKEKVPTLQYFTGSTSFSTKNYQECKSKRKPEKKPALSIESCLLLTLVRLRLGLTEMDLAFRNISQSLVSRILKTWVSFLARELNTFNILAKREDILRYYPKFFKKYKNVVGIIDCREVLEKPNLAKAQSRNTLKKLICITPGGIVSFISKSYGGAASDRFITESCGLINKLEHGDNLISDTKGLILVTC